MKLRIAAVMILITLHGPALAGFEGGVVAAKRGDYATAYREFRPLAEAGDPQAQHNLGVIYYNGRGVERNFAEAAKWFRRAAERGVAEAQSSLGYMYKKGEGVTQDYAQSTRWYRKAAEQEFGWAQYSLAAAYAAGEGVQQDMAEAAKWYRKASAQGIEVPTWTSLPSVFNQEPTTGRVKTASPKAAEEAADNKKMARSDPAKTMKAPKDEAKKKTPEKKTAAKKTAEKNKKTAVEMTPGAKTAGVEPAGVKPKALGTAAKTTPDTSTAPAIETPASNEVASTAAKGATPGREKTPPKSALKDAKPKTPGMRIAAAEGKPTGQGASAGLEPASADTMGKRPLGGRKPAGGKKMAGAGDKITGPATSGAAPASTLPIAYAPAAPTAPARLYDPPAAARLVAPSPPPIKASPPSGSKAPAIKSRPKAASSWRIQIAAVASAKAAKREWQRMASANDDLLGKLKVDILRADLGARGIFYRVQAGPLENKAEARNVCKALLKRKENCFVVPVK